MENNENNNVVDGPKTISPEEISQMLDPSVEVLDSQKIKIIKIIKTRKV